ncbi:MAG: hypothetical protein HC903_17190 [Methylacidiphilales bacterium]|nr:hypothetical protein [Candidatus Methylacidiphilales bacterium]
MTDRLGAYIRRVESAIGNIGVGNVTGTTIHVESKMNRLPLPLMCQVPALSNIFKWKCLQNSVKPQIIDKNNVQKLK